MSYDDIMYLLIGAFMSVLGAWLFDSTLKKTRNGYKSEFGYDIRAYGASACLIIAGIGLIYKAIFT